MRYVSTRGGAAAVSLREALFRGLAPDGGLYMPERIPKWTDSEMFGAHARSIGALGAELLKPYAASEIPGDQLQAAVERALDFAIPLVEVEPGVFALELFHGPTLAFKDVAARVMARLFAAFSTGTVTTILVATSGDTGSAVASAFAGVPDTRVVVLYPEGRVSPTQEAQLTMFNGDKGNVAAYAVAGSFDDCQRLVKQALADGELTRRAGLTSANSINIGRLLPQMVYYVHGVGKWKAQASRGSRDRLPPTPQTGVVVATPSGNFGNLTAGVMASQAGLPIGRFIAATNVNDIVPVYLRTGRYEPRASIATITNAMDVGNPSNFERLSSLYGRSVDAMRAEIEGSVHSDAEVRDAIKRVYETRGYLLDPHSAVGYLALGGRSGIFLATAHPAKFPEIVEPIIGRTVDVPPALALAISKRRQLFRIEPTLDALRQRLIT